MAPFPWWKSESVLTKISRDRTWNNCLWLVVSKPLKKNISMEGLSHILWKIKNVPNHQPGGKYTVCIVGLELRLLRHRTSTRRMMIIQMALISRVGSWHSSIRQVKPNFFLQVIWAKHDTSAGHLVYRLISTNCPRCFKLGSPTVLPLPSRAKVGVKTLEEQLANQSWDGWLVESSRNSLNCEFPKNIDVSIIESSHAFYILLWFYD